MRAFRFAPLIAFLGVGAAVTIFFLWPDPEPASQLSASDVAPLASSTAASNPADVAVTPGRTPALAASDSDLGRSDAAKPSVGQTVVGHAVEGSVRLATGSPLPSARVEARVAGSPSLHTATVAEDGTYRLMDLPPGAVEVTARATGVHPGALTVIRHLPKEGRVVLRVDFSFEEGSVCRGRVVDEGGRPIPGALVEVRVRGLFEPLSTESDEVGRFVFSPLPGAAARLFATAPGFVQRAPLEVALGRAQDLVLQLVRAGRIAGRVLDLRGRGFAGVRVEALPAHGAPAVTQTDAQGEFRFQALEAGAYRCRVSCSGYAEVLTEAVAVEVGVEARLPDVQLSEGLALTGRVLSASGDGVAGARVESRLPGADRGDHTLSEEDGSFEIRGLSPGVIVVRARAIGFLPGEELRVALPGGTGLVLRLEAQPVLEGTVTDAEGRALAGAWLTLLASTGRAARSEEDGGFVLLPPRPGIHEVLVFAPGHAPTRVELETTHPAHVILQAGPLALAAAPTLTGTLHRDGRPAQDLLILAAPAPGDTAPSPSEVVAATSDAEGRFALDLPAGPWELMAVDIAGHHVRIETRRVLVRSTPSRLTWELR